MIWISYIYRKVAFFSLINLFILLDSQEGSEFRTRIVLLGICLLARVIILSVTLAAYISTLLSLKEFQSVSLISRDKDW